MFESNVNHYAKLFPVIFKKAENAILTDSKGKEYLDFLAGAGSLNYGHNHPWFIEECIGYINTGGLINSLDLRTPAKEKFMSFFVKDVLQDSTDYKLLFPGPTGTNAVEAAIKLAKKATGKNSIAAFTNSYHGMTAGSLALTGSAFKRTGGGELANNVIRLPFDDYINGLDSINYYQQLFTDKSSGVSAPAAFIVEPIQGEGGVNAASAIWLQRLGQLAKQLGSLLIIDDIQAGCGRTGEFLSFNQQLVNADIICLSKSLSGIGLPMSLVVVKQVHDVLAPAEHNGTFRGNNLAFVCASRALDLWRDQNFVNHKNNILDLYHKQVKNTAAKFSIIKQIKGRGLFQGFELQSGTDARRVQQLCFEQGLILECCGSESQVIKLFPPLTITAKQLKQGFDILSYALEQTQATNNAKTKVVKVKL